MTTVRLFLAASGNEFMRDIAAAFQEGFNQTGCSCQIETDGLPSVRAIDDLQLVLAPHEYFVLSPARALQSPDRQSILRSSYLINVEQPGSSWFDLASEYAQTARGVFDISREGASEFRRRGIAAIHAPLGLAPTFAFSEQVASNERPFDVLFMGYASPRREQFIARHGAFFSNPRCRVVLSDVERPRTAATPGYVSGDERLRLIASSRILLNVHAADRTYFETHRALLALANGCLLVTETSRHTAPLREGQHFAMASLDELPEICQSYLDEPARLERVAQAGQNLALSQMPMSATCREMLETFHRDRTKAHSVGTLAVAHASWNPEQERSAVIARLTDARERRRLGQVDRDLAPNAAYQRGTRPLVSVIVTLYNYEAHIGECLRSVTASELPSGGLELVVVDDASTDASTLEARRIIDRSEIPAVLVSKHVNTGLADARNIGFQQARGNAVFVLDADNWIYPTCLRALNDVLCDGNFVATYGIVRRFSEETGEPLGLVSKYEWSVPDLVRAPYIDAMALFRRESVLEVGGYATELIEHGWFGWEDYDLWLTLAQAGLRCKLVPIVVGGYREHSSSMIHRTNTGTEQIARYFCAKFKNLVLRYPGLDGYFGHRASIIATGEVASVGARSAAQITEAEQLRAHCVELQRQVDDLHASASWKLTAPLRLAYDLLTGRSDRN